MGRTLRVGLLKRGPAKWAVEANWRLIEAGWHEAGRQGVDLFVTPECFLDGYVVADRDTPRKWTPARFEAVAQVEGRSPYILKARALCRRYGCYALLGLTEQRRGRYYNTALLLDRAGRTLGRYDKTHLQDHDLRFVPGRRLGVFELDVGRVGVVICADRRWPETMRTLRLRGAEAVLVPSYGMYGVPNEYWMRTRGYENECWVCFCHPSEALVIDPRGDVAARLASSVPGVLVEDLDLAAATDRMLRDRRPGLYETS